MDYAGLISGILRAHLRSGALGFGLFIAGCVTQQMSSANLAPKTFLNVHSTPEQAFRLTEQFLELHKGYNLRVRDPVRGLAVTDWTFDSPSERHRLTLRTSLGQGGALISAHTELQVLENQDWQEIPSSGQMESHLLAELKTYIERH